MTRQIKFRVWCDHLKSFAEYRDGYYYFKKTGEQLSLDSAILGSEKVTQYTGLKDKNGKPIFEGDIVKNGYGINQAIKWFDDLYYDGSGGAHSGFYFDGEDELAWNLHIDDSVVIGNIYENPELIK